MDKGRDMFPLSPRSSSVASESQKGTPETKLTTSPREDAASIVSTPQMKNGKSGSLTAKLKKDERGTSSTNTIEKDPFVIHEYSHGTRLSPTASSFSPIFGSANYNQPQSSGPISTIPSTDLGVSRALFIEPYGQLPIKEARSWVELIEAHGRRRHGNRDLIEENKGFIIQFSDVRDACSAYVELQLFNKGWRVSYVTQLKSENGKNDDTIVSESGQVNIQVMVTRSISENTGFVTNVIKNHLQEWGCLFAFNKVKSFADGSFQAVAEFCEKTAAATALAKGQKVKLEEIGYFTISPCHAENYTTGICPANQIEKPQEQHWPLQIQSTQTTPVKHHGMCINPQMGIYPFIMSTGAPNSTTNTIPYVLDSFVSSPPANAVNARADIVQPYRNISSPFQTPPSPALTAQNSFSPSRSGTELSRSDGRRQNAMRVSRSSYHNPSSHHNHVDVDRIREGIDVRTTIMLRNIPNKVDQTMLKRIVDESSWGKYDFMYLRIDFANDCNVGYAFINFVDPLDIIDFVETRGNQRWNCFKSDKVAEISYATIQGKDCLVQKFRNSSVMLEAAHYRPKLYFTSNGPVPDMAGQEEPFPDPDNQSKMKRSCENAEHVGLFTPNAGQHFRDEQRRRRSQYDRGTRLAALEEYDYEAAIQQLSGIQIP